MPTPAITLKTSSKHPQSILDVPSKSYRIAADIEFDIKQVHNLICLAFFIPVWNSSGANKFNLIRAYLLKHHLSCKLTMVSQTPLIRKNFVTMEIPCRIMPFLVLRGKLPGYNSISM